MSKRKLVLVGHIEGYVNAELSDGTKVVYVVLDSSAGEKIITRLENSDAFVADLDGDGKDVSDEIKRHSFELTGWTDKRGIVKLEKNENR